MTTAEKDLVHHYLRAVDLLGRMNPSLEPGPIPTSAYRHSAQALIATAKDIDAAITRMIERGEDHLFAPTLTSAMLRLDAEKRSSRTAIQQRFPPRM
ncbi:hypothetical protein [Nocardia noduli]|uniref:hypothetical protein n=1 Tax=Nocardia noduli TaxID=2815722 RepID=UPI001C210CBA|nr:hypothetical protein [Nocardia noduli]